MGPWLTLLVWQICQNMLKVRVNGPLTNATCVTDLPEGRKVQVNESLANVMYETDLSDYLKSTGEWVFR